MLLSRKKKIEFTFQDHNVYSYIHISISISTKFSLIQTKPLVQLCRIINACIFLTFFRIFMRPLHIYHISRSVLKITASRYTGGRRRSVSKHTVQFVPIYVTGRGYTYVYIFRIIDISRVTFKEAEVILCVQKVQKILIQEVESFVNSYGYL